MKLVPGEESKEFEGLGVHEMQGEWLFTDYLLKVIPLFSTSYQHLYLPSEFGWDVKGVPDCPNNRHHLNPFTSVISSEWEV